MTDQRHDPAEGAARARHEDCVVEMEHIRTVFGREVIHDDVNLCLRRGEVMGLVGGSGSGKTTLLREMIGLQRPSSGVVRVFGQALSKLNSVQANQLRGRWGVLFQAGALFTALSVFENIALPLRELRILDEKTIRRLVYYKLNLVGLSPRDADKMPAALSGGMIKRVALARALATEPELLLLDEPTAGLDPITSDRFVELIAGLRQSLGLTVALVTHDLDTLKDLCDRIAVLADRRVVTVGSMAEVAAVDHPFIQDYFGGNRGLRRLSKGA